MLQFTTLLIYIVCVACVDAVIIRVLVVTVVFNTAFPTPMNSNDGSGGDTKARSSATAEIISTYSDFLLESTNQFHLARFRNHTLSQDNFSSFANRFEVFKAKFGRA
jgi:hypothetical protein